MVTAGIDTLLKTAPNWRSQRIGFLTNDAARTLDGESSRVALARAGFHIVKLFSPEHGIDTKGEDGREMPDGMDTGTGLPIISLYGKKQAPDAEDLEDIDILLFDIPDAGTRFYTYLWSMSYCIESASRFQKKIVIIDRPNPLGGNTKEAEGPMLNQQVASFLGRFPMPITHGCTLGELAAYFNHTQEWKADLEIIPCSGWKRNMLFPEWQWPWINTSPAIQSFSACLLYPGLCFFEATNISVGRGHSYSFEWIGAPWMDAQKMKKIFDERLEGRLVTENTDDGIYFSIPNPANFKPVLTGLMMVKLVKDQHPNEFEWRPYPTEANPTGKNHLSLLMGVPDAEKIFDLALEEFRIKIGSLLEVSEWHEIVKDHLLYHNL
jgi:uncharacterized protein YbbC (DUF1343 family)